MTESELWRDIARRIERGEPYPFSHLGIRAVGLCDWLNDAVESDVEIWEADDRLGLFMPRGPRRYGYWWGKRDKDSRIIACGLLAAMAEEEE